MLLFNSIRNLLLRLLNHLLFGRVRLFFRFIGFRFFVFIFIVICYNYVLFVVYVASPTIFFFLILVFFFLFFFFLRGRRSSGRIVDVQIDVFTWQCVHAR